MSVALAGLAMGFLGSSHCIGMCGGIAGAVAAVPGETPSPWRQLLCHAGRIASYALMGAVAGSIGASFAGAGGSDATFALRGLAALLIVAAGLHVAGWPVGLGRLEAAGARVWSRIAPLARRARQGRSAGAALAFGALWGWLPCGFVYSALAVSAAAGSTVEGALVMAGFGLGTLPATFAMTWFAGGLSGLLRGRAARGLAGAMVASFGLWTLVSAAGAWSAADEPTAPCHHAAAPVPAGPADGG